MPDFKLKENYIKLEKNNRLYNLDIPIVGLTGGIATGKTTVSNILQKKGPPVICADSLVKIIYRQKQSVDFISSNFPKAISKGTINFEILRKAFFEIPELKKTVEQYLYAQLNEVFFQELAKLKNPKMIIYDVPLLFEKNLNHSVDMSVCVYCPRSIQERRLRERDQIEQPLIEKIFQNQMDIEKKKNLADFIIINDSTTKNLDVNVNQWCQEVILS